MVIFGPLVFYLFGPPVFIYSVVRFRSSDPVSIEIVKADYFFEKIVRLVIAGKITSPIHSVPQFIHY